MRKFTTYLAGIAAAAILAGTAQAGQGPVLEIEGFIGTIEVETGDFSEISIVDADGASIDIDGKRIVINDERSVRNLNCRYKNNDVLIGKHGGWFSSKRGFKSITQYPKVTIKAPANMHLLMSNSLVFGNVGDIGSGDIDIRSCGELKLGDVNGPLDLNISGSGDLVMGDAGRSDISVSGAGDLKASDLASADIDVSGAGDVEIGDILGHAEIGSSGAGDISIARIKGGLAYHGSGASDFDAEYVGGGDLSIRVSGSGDVSIKGGEVNTLYVKASGASGVRYGGASVSAEARASGAADITINEPSGKLRTSDSGAGDVHVKY